MNFSQKKILILGAGIYQVPLIQKAKKLGCYTIVTSIKGDYPGFEVADKYYYADTKNEKKILQIARDENIDGICTTGTDVAVKTLGYVCDNLGLKGVTSKAAELATDKINMKKAFQDNNVRTADFRVVSTLDQAFQAFYNLGKPILLKRTNSSGSRGIIKVDKIEQVREAFKLVLDASEDDEIIAEKFISGKEFGAQCLVYNNILEFIMPHGDLLFTDKTNIPIGHYVPLSLNENYWYDITDQTQRIVKALKLNNCAINFDFILNAGGVHVIEAGARAGATCLPELVSLHYGVDYYKLILELSINRFESMKFIPKQACGNLILLSKRDGVFDHLELINNKDIDINEFQLDVAKGDKINKFSVGPDRIGHIIIKGDSELDVLNKLKYLQESYAVKYMQ